LPSAVASIGPATTVRPVASASIVSTAGSLRRRHDRISRKRRPVSASSDSSTRRYLNASFSRIARANAVGLLGSAIGLTQYAAMLDGMSIG